MTNPFRQLAADLLWAAGSFIHNIGELFGNFCWGASDALSPLCPPEEKPTYAVTLRESGGGKDGSAGGGMGAGGETNEVTSERPLTVIHGDLVNKHAHRSNIPIKPIEN